MTASDDPSRVLVGSLNAALDYLQSYPTQSVWVMSWDAPSFPPKDEQMNENMVLLILAGPQMDTGRDSLAWIGRVATANVEDFEKKVGTTRAIQAWKSAIDAAAQNVGSHAARASPNKEPICAASSELAMRRVTAARSRREVVRAR